jgi:hypothetical protein
VHADLVGIADDIVWIGIDLVLPLLGRRIESSIR